MKQFGDCYRGRRVLLTGHTGFKGSWLSLWLAELGAELCGIALDPDTDPNHFELLEVDLADHRVDIRDHGAVQKILTQFQPELVFHLAAQPLVRRSYADPVANWSTNVMGSVHVLDACRATSSVQAIIAVTTDKVYQNREQSQGYQEGDGLGGIDPYSASKAACELLIDSYRQAFFEPGPLLASVRAGNVVGGGDWSEDRLIPDLVKAVASGETLTIRSPQSTRPWQHVLDCLSGYLQLGARLLAGDAIKAEAWNFGPDAEANRSVSEILIGMQQHWPELEWQVTSDPQPHEAGLLFLDTAKAKSQLNWQPVWALEQTLAQTAHWYREYYRDGHLSSVSQLSQYVTDAQQAGVCWIDS